MSEHDTSDDAHGRLSMWRAFGSQTGVALVLNNDVFLGDSSDFHVYSSPVAYLNEADFQSELRTVTSLLAGNQDFVAPLGRQQVTKAVFAMFRFATLCTKHPGFSEEREWRILYTPEIEPSPYLVKSIEDIGDTPQSVYSIPLRDFPEAGLVGSDLRSLLNRIIIGPTQYPVALVEAFVELLRSHGVPEPDRKVFLSGIPIRT